MKIETIEVYKCEFCRKLYQRKHFAIAHEIICKKNPSNARACFGCNHLRMETAKYSVDTFQGENYRTANLLFCKKLEKFVFPPIVEHKKNWIETDPIENDPMPKTCIHKSAY